MNGSKLLQVFILILCAVSLCFSYETYKVAKQLHEKSQAVLAKADSLMSIPEANNAAKSIASTGSKAASLLDEIVSDLEKDYKASRKESSKSAPKVRVSSSYKIEDRYVSYNVDNPEFVGNEAGIIIVDISVDQYGDVKKTSVNPASTITNEEVVDAARKAALKTKFNDNFDAPKSQLGTITFTYTKK